MRSCDVVIVGGGIGGSALGAALARDGLDVIVLEASEEYEDRVRGESMMVWGVQEARELGVEQAMLDAGAHLCAEWVTYIPEVPTAFAEANPIPVGMMVPGVSGSLNLRHPIACQALIDAAEKARCEVHRGVREVVVTAGPAPTVSWRGPAGPAEVAARLVVGADGRSSAVRRQANIALHRTPETHMIAGLLVEDLDIGPEHRRDFLAGGADFFVASFFQGPDQLRVYLCPPVAQRHRFSGPEGRDEFLRSTRVGCIPFAEALATATPAGPLATYPGDHAMTEEPFAEGVVLIGDAAGYSSPIIGQGLSCAMRDARMVRDVLRTGEWSPAAFAGYASERRERMRRLEEGAAFIAAVFADDGDAETRRARRLRFLDLQQAEPLLLGLLVSYHAGPEAGPPEAFDGRLTAAVLGAGA